tara:strand:+ start:338 stop:547 length:210 start_codon:yes stop_codon:yes gene_type:complete
MIFAAFMVMKIAFYIQNKEYFDLAAEQMQDGASWEYTGPRPTDPSAKSLPLVGLDGEKYIIFKLKKEGK